MKINFSFDDNLISSYIKQGTSPLISIWFDLDGVDYPEDDWLDFGLITLGWWTLNWESLVNGSLSADLYFMDGPFRIKVRREENDLFLSPVNEPAIVWKTTILELGEEIKRATNSVIRYFAERKLEPKELTSLKMGFEILNKLLPHIRQSEMPTTSNKT